MNSSLAVLCNDLSVALEAKFFAEQLNVPVLYECDPRALSNPEFVLLFSTQGLALQETGRKAPGPISADFIQGDVDHRRKFGGGKGQMIAKAVGIKAGVYPKILDATAGLGKDSFVLATLGCSIQLLERSPIVFRLLHQGLIAARNFADSEDQVLAEILTRMELVAEDSQRYLEHLAPHQFPDVIYLDPMFPERIKTADVKKEMRAFHKLVGPDADADKLLPLALARARFRVVVKRPRKASFLNLQVPSLQLKGKSSRYDIYTIKKLPEKLNSPSTLVQ